MKFACDVMLGNLARWLRICGIDVFYDASIDRSGLLRVAREEKRVVLTRSGNLKELKDIPPYVVIKSEDLARQLMQIKKEFPSFDPFAKTFTRCLECNAVLEEANKDSVKDEVPEKSFNLHEKFYRCPACKKVFWPGTHFDRMTLRLRQIFGGD